MCKVILENSRTSLEFKRAKQPLKFQQVNKEQYAMALKGCVSHFEGLRTRVDSVI